MVIRFLFLLLLPLFSFSQKKDTVFKYLDENLEFTTAKNASFFGVAVKKEDHWYLLVIYPDTTPLLKAYFKDKDLKIKNGPYTLFYPKNVRAKHGYYSNNKMSGIWRTWYPNGQIKDSGVVVNDRMSGNWFTWHDNGKLRSENSFKQDLTTSDILQLTLQDAKASAPPYFNLRNGKFTSYYADGTIESEGNFLNDQLHGEWRWYHSNGNLSTIEEYKNGLLNKLQCFDTTGKFSGDFCSIDKPAYLTKLGNYKEFIFRNLVWPEEAIKKRLEGEVKVTFIVTKNGELTDLKITGKHDVLKNAVQELFNQMKEWSPAIFHNRFIDWQEDFIIPFYRK